MEIYKCIIENKMDLIRACQLLEQHQQELPTQTTDRAKNWQKNIINEIETSLFNFDKNYKYIYQNFKNK